MSARRRAARPRGGGPRRAPCGTEEDLTHDRREQFEEGFRAHTSGGWRAGREAERQL